tara:strand:- start:212 stop:391 length:180 start_codon:yes stop_codon:yes gene_type:complete
MRITKITPRVTLNPKPYKILFLFGLPLSTNRNTRLEARLIKTNTSKIRIVVFNTGILKH